MAWVSSCCSPLNVSSSTCACSTCSWRSVICFVRALERAYGIQRGCHTVEVRCPRSPTTATQHTPIIWHKRFHNIHVNLIYQRLRVYNKLMWPSQNTHKPWDCLLPGSRQWEPWASFLTWLLSWPASSSAGDYPAHNAKGHSHPSPNVLAQTLTWSLFSSDSSLSFVLAMEALV